MKKRLNDTYHLKREDDRFIPVIERFEFVVRNLIQVVELLAQDQKENGTKSSQ